MYGSSRIFQVLFLLAAVADEFGRLKAKQSLELLYCGEHRKALARGEFRRMFHYKEWVYLVYRTKILIVGVTEKSAYGDPQNKSMVIQHPRIIDNPEEELNSPRLKIPKDFRVNGYYYNAKEDILIETYKHEAPFEESYLDHGWELDMKSSFPVAPRKRMVALSDVRTSWNMSLGGLIENPLTIMKINPEGEKRLRRVITSFYDILDYHDDIKMLYKRYHAADYYKSYRGGGYVGNFWECPWLDFQFFEGQKTEFKYWRQFKGWQVLNCLYGVLGDVMYIQSLDAVEKLFEFTGLTMLSGEDFRDEQDRINFIRHDVWWKWDQNKWGLRTMINRTWTLDEWLSCEISEATYRIDFKGIYNVDASSSRLFYAFFGSFYFRLKEDIASNCLYNLKSWAKNGTKIPMKFHKSNGDLDEEHAVRYEKINRMHVKNLRENSYYAPYEDTFKLSSSGGVLQARRTEERPKLLEAFRKCSHNTLLVEHRYVFCFLERTYLYVYDLQNENAVINARYRGHAELFAHLWPFRLSRYLIAIFDWKDDYVIFLCNMWMYVLRHRYFHKVGDDELKYAGYRPDTYSDPVGYCKNCLWQPCYGPGYIIWVPNATEPTAATYAPLLNTITSTSTRRSTTAEPKTTTKAPSTSAKVTTDKNSNETSEEPELPSEEPDKSPTGQPLPDLDLPDIPTQAPEDLLGRLFGLLGLRKLVGPNGLLLGLFVLLLITVLLFTFFALSKKNRRRHYRMSDSSPRRLLFFGRPRWPIRKMQQPTASSAKRKYKEPPALTAAVPPVSSLKPIDTRGSSPSSSIKTITSQVSESGRSEKPSKLSKSPKSTK